jgi:hypothetical protein
MAPLTPIALAPLPSAEGTPNEPIPTNTGLEDEVLVATWAFGTDRRQSGIQSNRMASGHPRESGDDKLDHGFRVAGYRATRR